MRFSAKTFRHTVSGKISAEVLTACVMIFVLQCFSVVECKKSKPKLQTVLDAANQTDAIQRLSRVFEIEQVPSKVFDRKIPPQFMLELYETITDSGGLIRKDGPYKASTIISFPDKAYYQQYKFHYNVSHIKSDEEILEAEFHVFRVHPRHNNSMTSPTYVRPSHLLEIKVYQILDPLKLNTPSSLRLLDFQRISAHVRGWLVFNVTKAVREWISGSKINHGFLVTTQTLRGHDLNEGVVRFAQRRQHHDSKQPILVLYTDDGRQRHPTYISPTDEGYREIKKDIKRQEKLHKHGKDFKNAIRFLNERDREEYGENIYVHPFFQGALAKRDTVLVRKKRSEPTAVPSSTTDSESERKKRRRERKRRKRNKNKLNKDKRALDYEYRSRRRRSCARLQMYVDFEEIGWSGWIISPKGYNAYHCKGECPFPLGQSQKPTNHATVQSIVHALRVGKDVSTPCCVPNKLYSISLLYFDDDENVILKQYDDMVAASCGCH